jgi:hypothetical protein
MNETIDKVLRVNPADAVRRRSATCRGLRAEVVQFTATGWFEYDFSAQCIS